MLRALILLIAASILGETELSIVLIFLGISALHQAFETLLARRELSNTAITLGGFSLRALTIVSYMLFMQLTPHATSTRITGALLLASFLALQIRNQRYFEIQREIANIRKNYPSVKTPKQLNKVDYLEMLHNKIPSSIIENMNFEELIHLIEQNDKETHQSQAEQFNKTATDNGYICPISLQLMTNAVKVIPDMNIERYLTNPTAISLSSNDPYRFDHSSITTYFKTITGQYHPIHRTPIKKDIVEKDEVFQQQINNFNEKVKSHAKDILQQWGKEAKSKQSLETEEKETESYLSPVPSMSNQLLEMHNSKDTPTIRQRTTHNTSYSNNEIFDNQCPNDNIFN